MCTVGYHRVQGLPDVALADVPLGHADVPLGHADVALSCADVALSYAGVALPGHTGLPCSSFLQYCNWGSG